MSKFKTYKHYKGGLYLKIAEALHAETNEQMVIYVCAVRGEVFARPKDSFYAILDEDNYKGPRFIPVPETDKEGAKNFLANGCKI